MHHADFPLGARRDFPSRISVSLLNWEIADLKLRGGEL
jgi:hypothetical protein